MDVETIQDQVEWETAALIWRRDVDNPRTRRLIQDHIADMGREGQYMRLFALYDKLIDAEEDLFWRCRRYEASALKNRPLIESAFIASFIPEDQKKIDKIRREIGYLESVMFKPAHDRQGSITPEMVERAKEYSIENLIEVKRGMALCIAHDEQSPSMDCRNGFVYCHACGFHSDAIGIYQRLYGVTFPEAVRALQ